MEIGGIEVRPYLLGNSTYPNRPYILKNSNQVSLIPTLVIREDLISL